MAAPKRGWSDGAGIGAMIEEADAGRFVGAADGPDFVRQNVPLVVFQAQDGAAAHARGGRGFVERPLQRRPRHSALCRRESVSEQRNRLDRSLFGH